jgi:hypothetical protein
MSERSPRCINDTAELMPSWKISVAGIGSAGAHQNAAIDPVHEDAEVRDDLAVPSSARSAYTFHRCCPKARVVGDQDRPRCPACSAIPS